MATYYPQYQLQQRYAHPITITEFNPIVTTVALPSPMNTSSVPACVVLSTTQAVTQICPYTGTLVAEPVLTSIIPSDIHDIVPIPNVYEPNMCCNLDQILESPVGIANEESILMDPGQNAIEDVIETDDDCNSNLDPLGLYLTLPKDLFPAARMFSLDPNPLIDEFCKLVNINDNTPWILDLEFGIPKVPVTRAIPVYDVQYNSIHCKNTPGAIHPGFESCSCDFKRVLLFYYDCIVSTWYKGYIIMSYDKSVKNFQSWLLIPMQMLGMCWP